MFQALSRKWKQACGEPELPEENSYYLACKAFQDNNLDIKQYLHMPLDLAKFKKDELPNAEHTFWEWFHSMMCLTEQYLKSIWKKGYVNGFVGKKRAEEMLSDKAEGTFLLRFSDSTLGGVTIGSKSK